MEFRFATFVRLWISWALCLALLSVMAGRVSAQVIVWATPTNAQTGDGQVSAEADFTRHTNGTLTLVLTNFAKNVSADGQEISGISFVVGGATGSGSLTTINSGLISTIADSGSYTAGVNDPLTRWNATETGTKINLTTLSGGQPDRLIIGPDDHGGFNPAVGSYGNSNSSIVQHDPVVLGTATFNLSIPGISNLSAINSVVFQFGTNAEAISGTVITGGGGPAVPEPGLVSLFAAMGVSGGLIAFSRRRRK